MLFERATQFYDSGLYKEAAQVFQLLKDGYPFGPYAEFAEVKVADCAFQGRDYPGAAVRYEEYLKQHPRSASTEYAAMQCGRSYQLAHKGVGRDATHLDKALENFDSFVKQYPNSMYLAAVNQYRLETVKSLIEQEELVIGYYRKMGKEQAVAAREQLIVARWGDPQAILAQNTELIEPQMMHASIKPLPDSPQIVAADYNSEAAGMAVTAVQEEHDNFAAIDQETTLSEPEEGVLNVECQSGKLFFTFESKVEKTQLVAVQESLAKESNASRFKIADAHFTEREIYCDGLGKVTLLKDGEVTVGSTLNLQFFSLNFPSRLVVSTL